MKTGEEKKLGWVSRCWAIKPNLAGHSGVGYWEFLWTEDLAIVSKQDSEPRLGSIKGRELQAKNGQMCEKYLGRKTKDEQAKQK